MKPILFNTEMVCAILDGRKTVTRRVVKPRYRDDEAGFQVITITNTGEYVRIEYYDEWENETRLMREPYNPGDILYVREAFLQTPDGQYWYKADNICNGCTGDGFCLPKGVPPPQNVWYL